MVLCGQGLGVTAMDDLGFVGGTKGYVLSLVHGANFRTLETRKLHK